MGQRNWDAGALLLTGGGAALLVAPFLPFLTLLGGFGGLSRSGMDMLGAEGFVFVVAGALLAYAGFQRAMGTAAAKSATPLVVSLIAAGATAYYYVQLDARVQEANAEFALASIGIGLWLAAGGSGAGLFGALLVRQVLSAQVPVQPASSAFQGPVAPSQCPYCGERLKPGATNCVECGAQMRVHPATLYSHQPRGDEWPRRLLGSSGSGTGWTIVATVSIALVVFGLSQTEPTSPGAWPLLAGYVALAVGVALLARSQGRSPASWFAIAVFVTPVIALLGVILSARPARNG